MLLNQTYEVTRDHLSSLNNPLQWNGMKISEFCRHMAGDELWPVAFAQITKVTKYKDRASYVRHEFLVIDAQLNNKKFWVRFDRSRTDRKSDSNIWEAMDTVRPSHLHILLVT